jgi:hypothetical protein
MNQIICKVAPALAAGCTMVLKPSEIAPLSAYLFAHILHEAAVHADAHPERLLHYFVPSMSYTIALSKPLSCASKSERELLG